MFTPVGPGGGVLTQCTVRDGEDEESTQAVHYGLVYGQPVCRLPAEPAAPAAATEQEDKEHSDDE
jgi:hypothetical protein